MKLKHRYDRWLILILALVLFSPSAVRVVTGGGGGALSGRAQFQRTVDTPSPGPRGTVDLKISGTKQSLRVNIRDLEGESYGLFLGFANNTITNIVCDDTNNIVCVTNQLTFEVFCTTNCVTNEVKLTAGLIGVMKELTNTHWVVEYNANNGFAPEQLSGCFTDQITSNCISDLSDLEGMFLFIATPAAESNTADAVLVAQVPPLTANNNVFSFKGRSNLTLTATLDGDPPPNTVAKGTVSVKFSGSQGRSLLDISAQKLFPGQVYTLWMSTNVGGVVDTEISDLELVGSKVRFKRDTKIGETLPLFASSVTDLQGFNFEIRDAFNDVHLEGTIP